MANEAVVGGALVGRLGRRAGRQRPALLGEAVSHFRAELIETAGSAIVVQLRPVERWLEAHSLQVAHVHYGRRSYVITAPGPKRQQNGGAGSASAG
jgi:hypothetical protein